MQFTSLALLGLSAVAIAAPVESGAELVARTGGTTVCCPKDKHSGCSVPPKGTKPPKDSDVYSCSFNAQLGLVNLFLCDLLNDLTLSVPITVSVPITL